MSFYNHEKMRALTIAAKASDAYSADVWGPVLWVQAAQMLCDIGLNEDEVEGVLRSKLTRWARDAYGEPSTYLGQYGEPSTYLGQLCILVNIARRDGDLHKYMS